MRGPKLDRQMLLDVYGRLFRLHYICAVRRGLHGARRSPARHFSSDSCSPAVDIIRRQIAVSLLRRRPWVRPYACAQIQRGDLDDASPSHEQVGLSLMHCLLCAACPACNVFLLNALCAWRACMHPVLW
jgi:hypothetical protein